MEKLKVEDLNAVKTMYEMTESKDLIVRELGRRVVSKTLELLIKEHYEHLEDVADGILYQKVVMTYDKKEQKATIFFNSELSSGQLVSCKYVIDLLGTASTLNLTYDIEVINTFSNALSQAIEFTNFNTSK